MNEQKIKKPLWKRWWFWVLIIALIGFANSKNDNSKNSKVTSTNNSSSQNKSSTNEIDAFDFSNVEVTKDNVLKALNKIGNNNVKLESVELTEKDGQYIIDVFLYIDTAWDENHLVSIFSNNAVLIYEKLFTNQKVNKVWVWASTKMIDSKGNESKENIINCGLTRNNASDINWSNFKSMVQADYNNLFNIADSKFIHPGIAKNLK